MKIFTVPVIATALFASACASETSSEPASLPNIAAPIEEAFVFTDEQSGEAVDAFKGKFIVPENRNAKDSREITIRYVRFPATGENPGHPVVYLAGGPGGSGVSTAKYRRFALFMAMREFGDVIAYDQRGTGDSDGPSRCVSSISKVTAQALSDKDYIALQRSAIDECEIFWRDEGVDIAGYTTVQNAHDLDDLRKHLGAEKITLWGTSYGSHLAFAALKQMEDRIHRVVLSSAEGLDQTVKLPARTDAYFDRLQAAVNMQPEAKALYPDIKGMMRALHAKLEAEPVSLEIPQENGEATQLLITKRDMQQVSSGLISDPQSAAILLALYGSMGAGDYQLLTALVQRFYDLDEPISWRGMSLAMDVASGISEERLALVNKQAETSLLADYLNYPMPHVRGVLGGLDLGDAFREAPVSDVPTLLLTGTLDGRTYPQAQQEAVAGLSDVTTVTVVHAGHNLFMSSPKVTETIQQFMRDEEIASDEIILPLPNFLELPF